MIRYQGARKLQHNPELSGGRRSSLVTKRPPQPPTIACLPSATTLQPTRLQSQAHICLLLVASHAVFPVREIRHTSLLTSLSFPYSQSPASLPSATPPVVMDAVSPFGGPSSPPRALHSHSGSTHDFNSQTGNGAVAVPSRPPGIKGGPFAGHTRNSSSVSGANGLARSPPNKNTTHVPCKFFRQGNCQAGSACPFDHSMEPEPPCKYFMKVCRSPSSML